MVAVVAGGGVFVLVDFLAVGGVSAVDVVVVADGGVGVGVRVVEGCF